jgi:hypothetical protein
MRAARVQANVELAVSDFGGVSASDMGGVENGHRC